MATLGRALLTPSSRVLSRYVRGVPAPALRHRLKRTPLMAYACRDRHLATLCRPRRRRRGRRWYTTYIRCSVRDYRHVSVLCCCAWCSRSRTTASSARRPPRWDWEHMLSCFDTYDYHLAPACPALRPLASYNVTTSAPQAPVPLLASDAGWPTSTLRRARWLLSCVDFFSQSTLVLIMLIYID